MSLSPACCVPAQRGLATASCSTCTQPGRGYRQAEGKSEGREVGIDKFEAN